MAAETDEIDEQDAPDEGDDEEEKPPIEDEEFADLSAVADEIEESAGAGSEDDEEDVDDQEDSADQKASSEDHTRGSPRGRGWGDMYVASVTSGLNAVIDEHGKDGSEPLDEQMARDLHLDEAFEEVMEKRGRADMPPEQELLMGTLILAGTVVLSKTDLPAQALSEVGDDA
ncbi:hypothetical protein [Haloplanus rubicundus]|uniref:Uncharacterized protein n=1 Tax=Haloplanus rubicundus TaxID=1547898 RepID=A0A345EBB5_9EURY|nr:hypothetical protein [Haloplanus rubicundus]AXG09487.1 hypothetical protein DU484_06175 [Haloplanus rubicundus]